MKSTLWLAVVLWASVAAAVVTTLASEQDSAVDLAVSDGVDFFSLKFLITKQVCVYVSHACSKMCIINAEHGSQTLHN